MPRTVYIDYTNWRGERSVRRVTPIRWAFEACKPWYPNTCWLMYAYDEDRKANRVFEMSTIRWFSYEPFTIDNAQEKEL